MVYNRAYGVLACVAGRFPLKGNYTTIYSKPNPYRLGFFLPETPLLARFRTPAS